jgi:CRISPR-associated protein Cas1
MDYSGNIISSILPPTVTKADLRFAQFQAANDHQKRLRIAKALVQAKIARSLRLLGWLAERYDITREIEVTKEESINLPKTSTIPQIRTVEGRTALRHWEAYKLCFPEHLGFQGRVTSSRNNNASDCVNLALNYGYGFLEAEVRMAVNSVGLEPSVGFLHEFASYQTKQSLVYDLQEPFRWLVDLTVIQAFESGALKLSDFYFAEQNYRLRFDMEAKGRYLNLLREQFNAGIPYKGRRLKWDTVIEQKTSELARYLSGKNPKLDFSEPAPTLQEKDNETIRTAILNLNSAEAKKLGIPKQTLCDLRKRARTELSFRVYSKIKHKIEGTELSSTTKEDSCKLQE